jgi:UDP-hydrolysing UDP-N-acetyl-D-glucosamine 2-epimerase
VLVIADRTETLGVAMAASIMQIPLIHLQGGEVSGSIDDKIRDANSKLADLHLTTNEQTAQRLINSGEDPSRVFPIGCPSIDLVAELENDSSNFSEQTASNLGGVGSDFSLEQPYGIIMFHPDTLHEVENIEWCQRLISMAEASDFHWFWFWPNPDHGSHAVSHEIRVAREKGELGNVRFIINLSPEDFVRLSARAKVMIGNSSFGIRESSYIGLPVMNLGKRQGGRQKSSNVIDCPELESVASLMSKMNNHISVNRFPPSSIYGNGSAGKHAAEIIANWVPSLKVRV